MVVDEVCVIDEIKREVQLLALVLSTVLGLNFNKPAERKLSWPSVARIVPLRIRLLQD